MKIRDININLIIYLQLLNNKVVFKKEICRQPLTVN